MNRKLVLILTAVAVALSSCATNRTKKFESALQEGQCDVALENIPENDTNVKYIGRAERAAGKALSYAVTGAGYTADVVLTVVGGVVVVAALCAPLLVAATAGSAGGTGYYGGPLCFPANISDSAYPTLGKQAYKNTEEWRCPDLTALSRSVRRVAKCHADQLTADGNKNAVTTISSVRGNKGFMSCITKEESAAVHADFALYEKRGS